MPRLTLVSPLEELLSWYVIAIHIKHINDNKIKDSLSSSWFLLCPYFYFWPKHGAAYPVTIPGAIVRSCIFRRNWAKEESDTEVSMGGWLKLLNWLKPWNFLHKFISMCRWIANALQGLEVRWICEKGLFHDELSMFILLFNMEISGNCMVANWSACRAWLMHQHNCIVHVGEWLLSGIDLSHCEEIVQSLQVILFWPQSPIFDLQVDSCNCDAMKPNKQQRMRKPICWLARSINSHMISAGNSKQKLIYGKICSSNHSLALWGSK